MQLRGWFFFSMQEAQNSGESLPVTCLNRDVSEQDFSEV